MFLQYFFSPDYIFWKYTRIFIGFFCEIFGTITIGKSNKYKSGISFNNSKVFEIKDDEDVSILIF
jgi:hypothetical protein